jgi:hypothetical protein
VTFPTDYGCEIYEGDANIIGSAISTSNWMALRTGIAARLFVGFPRFIDGSYFDFFGDAVASVLHQPEVLLQNLKTIAGEDADWGAYMLPREWTSAVASVPANKIWLLARFWREAYLRVYGEQEPWPDNELLDPLYRLTLLCKDSLSQGTDVVLLAI